MSKWFVGSSSINMLACCNNSFTKDRRTFSPPDKTSTVLNTSSAENRNCPNTLRTAVRSKSGYSSHTSSKTVLPEENCASCWSKYPCSIWWPNKKLPDKAGTIFISVFTNVDFPVPFGPMIAILSPRRIFIEIVVRTWSYPIARFSTSNTFSPPFTRGVNLAWNVLSSVWSTSIRSIRSKYLILDCAKAALFFL